jgi:AraC family transcriptional regulator
LGRLDTDTSCGEKGFVMLYETIGAIAPPHYDKVAPKFEMLLSSEAKGWKNLQLHTYKLLPQPEPVAAPVSAAHTLQMVLGGVGQMSINLKGSVVRAQVCPGTLNFTPCGVTAAYGWAKPHTLAYLYLSPALTAYSENSNSVITELVPHSFFRDPFIEQLCLALVRELEAGAPLGARYADGLAQAIALHLLRHYSGLHLPKDLPSRGLSQQQLWLVIDFIEDNLTDDIGLEDLATLINMSPACFTKQFKHTTGLPPHQYLIQQRVERAKELLSVSTLSIAEVSQTVGFFDQSHLVRHFKYWVGVTPRDYRDSKLKN